MEKYHLVPRHKAWKCRQIGKAIALYHGSLASDVLVDHSETLDVWVEFVYHYVIKTKNIVIYCQIWFNFELILKIERYHPDRYVNLGRRGEEEVNIIMARDFEIQII